MFNIDPKKMMGMMKQLGIKQEQIDAKKVIIEREGSKIIIENPQVAKIVMQGQETFQISGEVQVTQATESEDSEEDIQQIMEKTQVTRSEAEKALKQAKGDLAEAILSLS